MELLGLFLGVTLAVTIIVAPSVVIGLVANWLINSRKQPNHDALQAMHHVVHAHYDRVTTSMSSLCDRVEDLEKKPAPAPVTPQAAPAPVAKKVPQGDNGAFFNDCVEALIALGTPKRQAKGVARNSFNRRVPATIQEFITQTLIKPNQ